jgi:hypothetical protein
LGTIGQRRRREEEQPQSTFKFGSDKEDTPDENIDIPATDAAAAVEEQLEQLASNIPTDVSLPNSHLPPSTSCQHHLIQWPQSQQLPLSLQQLYWAELLDLQYPPTPSEADHLHLDLQEEEEDTGQVKALLWEEDHLDPLDLLEEGEIMEEESL